jgi:hypothetical protein
VRPLPSRQILVEEADPNDPDVGCDNAKRGWPRGLWQRAEDGGRQFVSYTVLDHDDPRSAMAALSGRSIGERVIERATAEGKRRSDIALPDDD